MTGRWLRTRHAGSFLARQRWSPAESSRLGVPDARSSMTPTNTYRPNRQGGHQGLRQFVEGRGQGDFPDGLLHVVVRRQGPRNWRLRRLRQRRAHARDVVRVVRGIVRAHGGLEAREVHREARVTAMQLLRLVEQLRLEGLRCCREPTPSGLTSVRRRNLSGRSRSVRPVWDIRVAPFSLAFSTCRSAPYAASWRSCHRA